MTEGARPSIVVLSTLYPAPGQPTAGLFIQERMRHVARHLPVTVIAPAPWFPLQRLIRRWRPHFRTPAPRLEVREGLEIHRPRFLSIPGVCKSLDGFFMALGSFSTLRRLQRADRADLVDAHFAYPDGYAASLLASWSCLPFTVTLRGTEPRLGKTWIRGALIKRALLRAERVIAVSTSLSEWSRNACPQLEAVDVIGNGVDTTRFRPIDQSVARDELKLDSGGPVLVSVGGLTERKGFHRVLECLPRLRRRWPDLQYLIVGGASAEGDWRPRLERQVGQLGLEACVRFLGVIDPADLHIPLSAADVFVLATRNEGWANVLLEAMACGLPVVTTDVGGNRQVVKDESLGLIVPFDDQQALGKAIDEALAREWDRDVIRRHAEMNSWERVARMVQELMQQAAHDRSDCRNRRVNM